MKLIIEMIRSFIYINLSFHFFIMYIFMLLFIAYIWHCTLAQAMAHSTQCHFWQSALSWLIGWLLLSYHSAMNHPDSCPHIWSDMLQRVELTVGPPWRRSQMLHYHNQNIYKSMYQFRTNQYTHESHQSLITVSLFHLFDVLVILAARMQTIFTFSSMICCE